MNGTLAAKNQYFHIQIETQKTTQRRFRFGTNDSNAVEGTAFNTKNNERSFKCLAALQK